MVGKTERVELLRHGIVVVGADAGVDLTGAGEDRVFEIARRVLGSDVEIFVLGDTPRRIVPRRIDGQMEREEGRLQLRIALRGDEHVDDIVVAEDEHFVVAFATVCTAEAGEEGGICDVPCHVHLDAPLGERTVIDGSTGAAVPYRNVYAEIEAKARASRS